MLVEVGSPCKLAPAVCQKLNELYISIDPECQIAYNVMVNAPVYLFENVRFHTSKIDAYSYVQRESFISTSSIGRYCSIAHRVDIGMGYHNYKAYTTSLAIYPNLFMNHSGQFNDVPQWLIERNNIVTSHVNIGHDVWIGADVKILADVTIGHGAVIGTNAVITKDVPPYAVVDHTGKVKRYRFSDEIISDLMELKWWNYDLPRALGKGIHVPQEDPKELLAFMRNEDISQIPKIEQNWKHILVESSEKVRLMNSSPDLDLNFSRINIDESK